MMLDLSPQKTLIDCSGEGHIMAKELGKEKPSLNSKGRGAAESAE